MWKNYLKTALRTLRKYKSYTLVNIIGLAIGLSIVIALILYLQFELSFDNFHKNASRIYRIEQVMNEGGRIERMSGCPTPLGQALLKDFPEIEASIRVVPRPGIDMISYGGDQFIVNSFFVDKEFLDAFSFNMLQGDPETALSDPFNIVITKETAVRLFENEDVLGEMYAYDDVPLKITGVIENVPENSHLEFDVLFSINTLEALYGDDTFTHWGDNWVPLYVMLVDDHDIYNFNEKIKPILKEYFYEETLNELETKPLKDIHLYCDYPSDFAVKGNIKNIYILAAIALFILIMASVNFTNLSVAYSVNRTREVGLRKVNGATKGLLIKQYLAESMLMVLIALFFAFVIFETFLPWFNQVVNRDLDLRYLENYPVFLLIIGIGILIGFLSGIYPAYVLSRFQPQDVLKGKGLNGGKKQGLRKVLIAIQFVISAFFIISTLGVLRQVTFMKNKDLGFEPENVIRFNFSDSTTNRILYLREQLLQNPDVISASVHDYPIVESTNWTRVSWEGADEEEWIRINDNYSDHHFTDTYKMELIEGEGFAGPQRGTAWEGNEVIINEAAVKRMGMENPVGKWIYYSGDYRGGVERGAKIAGVVKDYHFISVHNMITPMMIRLYNENQLGWSLSVRTTGQNLEKIISFIETKFNDVFPGQLFDYHFVNEFHEEMYQEEQKLSSIIFYLAILAIIIACLGVYGMVSFTTARRTREIVMRKVLGSRVLSINFLFAKEYVILILIANVISWPIAYIAVNRWLQAFPYSVEFSVVPYIIALLITLLFALFSMVIRTTRAAMVNPSDILRYE